MKSIKFLILIVGIFVLAHPNNCFAKAKNFTNGASFPTECANKTRGDVACKSKAAAINISAYDLDTTVHSTTVNPRKITISGASGVSYKVIVLDATSDKMDQLRFKKDKELTINENLEQLEDTVADLNGVSFHSYRVKNGKKKDGEGDEFSYTLVAGHEAIVITLVNSHPSSGVKCDSSEGAETMQCKMGQITKIDGADDIKLSGTASFAYFQNPTGNSLIANIKGLRSPVAGQNKACSLASQGKYMKIDDDDNVLEVENSKFSLQSSELGEYQSLMYNKVLGNFCNSDVFAFLLTDKQIRNLSNSLLKVFYYRKNATNTYDQIDTVIKQIEEQYGITGSKNTTVNARCEAENMSYTQGEKHFLYKDEKPPVSTGKLSNGRSYPVCQSICYEHLTLNYSPPVASKAGLCFSYKVTVKSETECGVKYEDGYLDALVTKEACAPTAVCGSHGKTSQAGPNEEFDRCVKKCDGGKYSQDCINQCYTEVYKNKKTKTNDEAKDYEVTNTSSNQKNASISSLELTVDKEKYNTSQIAKIWNNDEFLKNYYNESEVPNHCKTSNIMDHLDECAKFYYIAKSLKPMGHYDLNDEQEIVWKNNSGINNNGITAGATENVPMQVGRSAPMYFRSLEETKETLRRLYGKWSGNPGRKYVIDADGFLRQWNSTYKCDMDCRFTGCNKNDAMSAVDYIGEAKDDLDKIEDALKKCQTNETCGKEEKDSTFTINIDTPVEAGTGMDQANVSANGVTTMGQTSPKGDVTITPSKECTSSNPSTCDNQQRDPYNMFIPADVDDHSSYGILGLCYDRSGANRPHYQTTWTFPGSWINLKSGETVYTRTCDVCDFYERRGYYCLPYNTSEVNVDWWKWRVSEGKYSYVAPDTWNINAEAHDFGEYKWNITLSCFYAIRNETIDICVGDDCDNSDCVGDECNKEQDCEGEECSTKITNYRFKIYDPNEPVFDDDEVIGYNWTSKAKINPSDQGTTAYTADEQSYFKDPEEYRKELSPETQKYESESDAEYYFELSTDDMKKMKKKYNKDSYTEYKGRFSKEPLKNLKMSCYHSDIVDEFVALSSKGKRPTKLCVNNLR